jgi:hypothetical protein
MIALTVIGMVAAFVAGAALAAFRFAKLQNQDPWRNPPNRDAFRFKAACEAHYFQHVLRHLPGVPPPSLPIASGKKGGNSVLRVLSHFSGVLVVRDGTIQLPGAREINLGRSANDIERALTDAYLALRSASVLLTHYVTNYETPQEAMQKPNEVLQEVSNGWAPIPMGNEISALARLVDGVSSTENPVCTPYRYEDLRTRMDNWRAGQREGEPTRLH